MLKLNKYMIKKYFDKFEKKFSHIEEIDSKFYENFGVTSFCSLAKTKDSKGNPCVVDD